MDTENIEYTAKDILLTLKKIMKQKGMTYKVVANKVGMTESGLKKIFISNDCSFNRLSQISNVVGLSMTELLRIIEPPEIQIRQFTDEEEVYFLKHFECFNFYWCIVYDGLDVELAKEQLKISEKKMYSYLKKLDDFSLIEWQPNNEIVRPKIYFVWKNQGKLIQKIKLEWSKKVLEDSVESTNAKNFFTLRYLRLREESHKEFLDSVNKIIYKFEKISKWEILNYSTHEIKSHRILFNSADGSFVTGPERF